jgi:hypothetical protein
MFAPLTVSDPPRVNRNAPIPPIMRKTTTIPAITAVAPILD